MILPNMCGQNQNFDSYNKTPLKSEKDEQSVVKNFQMKNLELTESFDSLYMETSMQNHQKSVKSPIYNKIGPLETGKNKFTDNKDYKKIRKILIKANKCKSEKIF